MRTTLLDIKGWDIFVENDFFYFQKIIDKFGEENSYHKSDITNIWTISENEYNAIKYGPNHKNFLPSLPNINEAVKLKNGSVICTGFMDYIFYFIDQAGKVINKREDIGFDSIYSFDMDTKENIWYAIPTAHYIGQFSMEKSEDIYHLGNKYEEYKPLSFPEDIKIYGDYLYISDMGSKQILRLNINTKELISYLQFDEPTWEYRQFRDKEIVRLKSGIYLINN